MAVCLCQYGDEQPFFKDVEQGGKLRILSGMICRLFEKYLWVLKQYPLQPHVSSVVVAVTDFICVEFYLSNYHSIQEKPFYVLTPRSMSRISNRQMVVEVDKRIPR